MKTFIYLICSLWLGLTVQAAELKVVTPPQLEILN